MSVGMSQAQHMAPPAASHAAHAAATEGLPGEQFAAPPRTTLSGSIVGTSGGALSSPRLSSPPPPLPAAYRPHANRHYGTGTGASVGSHLRESPAAATTAMRPPPVPPQAQASSSPFAMGSATGSTSSDTHARKEQLRHIRAEVTRLAASAAPASMHHYQPPSSYGGDFAASHGQHHTSGPGAGAAGGMGSSGSGSSSAVVMTALSTLRARIRNLEAEKASASKEAGRLQATLAEERARHAAQVKDLETAAQLDAARMRTTAGNLTAERGELEVKVVKLEASATALQRDLAFAQQQARVEMEDKRAQEARAAAAEARASSLQALLEQEQASQQAHRTEAARQQAQAAERNAQLRRLVEQLQTALGTETGLRQGVEAAKRRAEAVLRGVVKINEELVASLLQGGAGPRGKSGRQTKSKARLKKALTRTRDLARQVLGPDLTSDAPGDAPASPGAPGDAQGGNGDEAPAGPRLQAPVLRERRQQRAQRERPWRGGGGTVGRRVRSGRSKGKRQAKGKSGGGSSASTAKVGAKGGSLHERVVVANGRQPIPFILGSSTARSQNVYGALQQALSSPAAYGTDSPKRGALQPAPRGQRHGGSDSDSAPAPAPGPSAASELPAWAPAGSVGVVGLPVAAGAHAATAPVASASDGQAWQAPPVAQVAVAPAPPSSIEPAEHDWAFRGAAGLSASAVGDSGTGPEHDLEGVIAGLEDEFRQLNARYSALLFESQVCEHPRGAWPPLQGKRNAETRVCCGCACW